MTIILTRNKARGEGREVRGTLTLPFEKPLVYATLENRDYLIPEGTYPLRLTWSPKFRKNMPEICDVPDRDGIRIHMGTRPEHSTGCVLVSYEAMENTKAFINRTNKYYENEQLFIQIKQGE